MSDMINGQHHLSNTGLTTHLSMAYMFTKPLELLIHRLGSPKCVVARISGCPDIFDVKRNFVVTVRRTGTFLVYYKIVGPILATGKLRCHNCIPNSEWDVWWTSVSTWFLP